MNIHTLFTLLLLNIYPIHSLIVKHTSEPFDDWIRPAAAHGVNTFYRGQFMNFKTFWNQIFVMKFPRRQLTYIAPNVKCTPLNMNDLEMRNKLSMAMNINISSDSFIRKHEQILLNECANFTAALQKLRLELDTNVQLYAHESALLSLKRSRRQFLIAGAFLAGALFSWLLHPKQRDHVADDIDSMHSFLSRTGQHDMMLSQSLLGMSHIVDSRTMALNEKQSVLSRHFNAFQEQLNHVRTNVFNQTLIDALSFDATHRLLRLLEARGELTFEYLNREKEFIEFQEGIIELQKGHLSHRLVSLTKLKEKLNIIGANLPKRVKLAFPYNQWDLFYSLPLSAYTVHGDSVFIRVSIPLVQESESLFHEMYHLSTLPVPCAHDLCTGNKTGKFGLQLNVKDTILIRQNKTIKSVNQNTLKCTSSGIGEICWSFDQNSVQTLSPCLKAIVNWSPSNVDKFCGVSYFPMQDYKPTQVIAQTFALHRPQVQSYSIVCPTFRSDKNLTTWSEIVKIPPQCKLEFNDTTLFGSFNLNYTEDVTFQEVNFTMFDGILNDVKQPLLNDLVYNSTDIPEPKLNFTDGLNLIQKDIVNEEKSIAKDMFFNHPYFSFHLLLNNVWTILTSLFFTWFLMSQIRNNNWFYLTTFTVIENVQPSYCFDLTDLEDMFTFNYYSLILNMVTICIISVVLLFTLRFCFFPKLIFNNYVAYHGDWTKDFRFCISICIEDTIDFLSSRNYCQTFIYIPLSEFSDLRYVNVEMNVNRKLFIVNQSSIKIFGPVEVRAYDSGGQILDAKKYCLDLNLEQLVWAKNLKPVRLDGLSGCCSINATSDPTPIQS